MKKTIALFLLTFVPFVLAQDRVSTKQLNLVDAVVVPQVMSASVGVRVPGARSAYYWIVSKDANGFVSLPSGPFASRFAPSTITANNPILISWQPVSGVVSYDVLRTSTVAAPAGVCNCAVATGLTATNASDKSELLNNYTVAGVATGFVITSERVAGVPTIFHRYNGETIFGVSKSGLNFAGSSMALNPATTPDVVGNEIDSTHSSVMFRGKWTQNTGFESWPNIQGMQLYYEAISGGYNQWNGSSGSKTTYTALASQLIGRTVGQMIGNGFGAECYSHGDCIGASVGTRRYGGTRTNGDEGNESLSVSNYGGTDAFTATATGVVNGPEINKTVTYSGAQNEGTRGEGRLVVNKSRGVYSTGTATVANEYATPVVITGSGTSWTSLGSANGKCFEFDATNIGGNQYRRVPIRSIDSDTQITLDFVVQNGDQKWSIDSTSRVPSSGTYKIYNCAPAGFIRDANNNIVAGKITVSIDSNIQAGDQIEMGAIDYAQSYSGIRVKMWPTGYPVFSGGISVDNFSPDVRLGTLFGGSGLWMHGLYLQGNYSHSVMRFRPTTPPANAYMFVQSDQAGDVCEPMLGAYKYSGSVVKFENCRASSADADGWRFSGKHYLGNDGRASIGSQSPLGGVQLYTLGAGNNIVQLIKAGGSGNLLQGRNSGGTDVFDVKADGTAWHPSMCYNSAHTVCDTSGSAAPTGACTSGSTHRNTTTGKFSVCESGAWVTK